MLPTRTARRFNRIRALKNTNGSRAHESTRQLELAVADFTESGDKTADPSGQLYPECAGMNGP